MLVIVMRYETLIKSLPLRFIASAQALPAPACSRRCPPSLPVVEGLSGIYDQAFHRALEIDCSGMSAPMQVPHGGIQSIKQTYMYS